MPTHNIQLPGNWDNILIPALFDSNVITMDSEDQHHPQTNSKLWLSISAVIILTGIAIWLIPSQQPDSKDIPLPSAVTEPVTTPPTQLDAQPNRISGKEGDKARQIISRHKQDGGSVDALYAQALELNEQGELADAYLLLFYIARNGHPESALMLGKHADPATFYAGASILEQADMVQAHKWYKVAAAKGNAEAKELLQQLKLYVSDQAGAGDPLAEGLMLQWK